MQDRDERESESARRERYDEVELSFRFENHFLFAINTRVKRRLANLVILFLKWWIQDSFASWIRKRSSYMHFFGLYIWGTVANIRIFQSEDFTSNFCISFLVRKRNEIPLQLTCLERGDVQSDYVFCFALTKEFYFDITRLTTHNRLLSIARI